MRRIDWAAVLKENQRKACIATLDLAGAYRELGRYREGEAEFRRAEILAAALENDELRLSASSGLGNLYYHRGRFSQALAVFRTVEVRARAYNMQKILMALGDYTESLRQSSAALTALSRSEPAREKCWLMAFHLNALLQNGILGEAWRVTKRLANFAREDLESPFIYMVTWLSLAHAYLELGQAERAQHWAIRALGLAENAGHVPHRVTAQILLARVTDSPGRRTVSELEQVEKDSGEFREDPTPLIRLYLALGEVLLQTGDAELAIAKTKAARGLLRRYRRFPEALDSLILQARCEIRLTNWSAASRLLARAARIEATELRVRHPSLSLPLAYAEMWSERGDESLTRAFASRGRRRYKRLVAGLPKVVRTTFDQRPDVRRLHNVEGH
jgi:tetratricopeptide (TPR) repeat protein